MITILHGDNISASRLSFAKTIEQQKLLGKEIIRIDGEKVSDIEFIQACEAKSLFNLDKVVVIENLFSRKPSKQKEALLKLLNKNASDVQMIIWEKKQINASAYKQLKDIKINLFSLNSAVYKFLDSLKPGNTRTMLLLFHEAIKKDASELVFYLFQRRIFELILAKESGKSSFSKKSPWLLSRLLYQAKYFTFEKLLFLHYSCYHLDKNNKQGKIILNFKSELDLLIAQI
jgi:hypothetical protein